MNEAESPAFDTAVALFESVGKPDTHAPGTPTGEDSSWLFTKSQEKRETPHKLGRRTRYAERARFKFWRTTCNGQRYDGYVVVSFMADPRDGYSGYLLAPCIYTRWYDLTPVEDRVSKADCKDVHQDWLTTGRIAMAVDEALAAFDEAAATLLENAEVCGSDRRTRIAAAAEEHWNEPPSTTATSLSEFQ